jgi:hypothetical protein
MRYELSAQRLHRITTLIIVAGITLGGDSRSEAESIADSPGSPNIVFILADDK